MDFPLKSRNCKNLFIALVGLETMKILLIHKLEVRVETSHKNMPTWKLLK